MLLYVTEKRELLYRVWVGGQPATNRLHMRFAPYSLFPAL
jgi:hypothetical protein